MRKITFRNVKYSTIGAQASKEYYCVTIERLYDDGWRWKFRANACVSLDLCPSSPFVLFLFAGKSTITIITTSDVVKGDTVPQKLVRKTILYRFSLADMPHTFASFSRTFLRVNALHTRARAQTHIFFTWQTAFSGKSPWRFFFSIIRVYSSVEIYHPILIRPHAETGDVKTSLWTRGFVFDPRSILRICIAFNNEETRDFWDFVKSHVWNKPLNLQSVHPASLRKKKSRIKEL